MTRTEANLDGSACMTTCRCSPIRAEAILLRVTGIGPQTVLRAKQSSKAATCSPDAEQAERCPAGRSGMGKVCFHALGSDYRLLGERGIRVVGSSSPRSSHATLHGGTWPARIPVTAAVAALLICRLGQ